MILVQNQKNLEKTKKKQKKQNSTDYGGPRASHRAIVSRVLVFLVFLVFSRFL